MDPKTKETLKQTSVATLTTVLLKRGIGNTWINGARPYAHTDQRVIGPAFTMRFIPARDDLATPAAWKSPTSSRVAIEAMPDGCVCVVDARGINDAGILGDILATRMRVRGVAGLITDGVVRDADGMVATGLPVWCGGTAAPPALQSLAFVGWQEPIGCGGTAVFPDDIMVADADGAVVIPQAIASEVANDALDQERLEAWVVEEVEAGRELPGLYPPNDETMARYRKVTGQE